MINLASYVKMITEEPVENISSINTGEVTVLYDKKHLDERMDYFFLGQFYAWPAWLSLVQNIQFAKGGQEVNGLNRGLGGVYPLLWKKAGPC